MVHGHERVKLASESPRHEHLCREWPGKARDLPGQPADHRPDCPTFLIAEQAALPGVRVARENAETGPANPVLFDQGLPRERDAFANEPSREHAADFPKGDVACDQSKSESAAYEQHPGVPCP